MGETDNQAFFDVEQELAEIRRLYKQLISQAQNVNDALNDTSEVPNGTVLKGAGVGILNAIQWLKTHESELEKHAAGLSGDGEITLRLHDAKSEILSRLDRIERRG